MMHIPGFLTITLLLSLSMIVLTASAGSAGIAGADVWTYVGRPVLDRSGTLPVYDVTYRNNANITVAGIVYMVIHNSLGQTVAYSTASLTLASNATGTAHTIIFGLNPGAYNATFFATSLGGVAISNTTTATFTLPF